MEKLTKEFSRRCKVLHMNHFYKITGMNAELEAATDQRSKFLFPHSSWNYTGHAELHLGNQARPCLSLSRTENASLFNSTNRIVR